MLIIEFDRLPSWSLNVSETGESTKCLWVGVVEGTVGEKNKETDSFNLSRVQGAWLNFGPSIKIN